MSATVIKQDFGNKKIVQKGYRKSKGKISFVNKIKVFFYSIFSKINSDLIQDQGLEEYIILLNERKNFYSKELEELISRNLKLEEDRAKEVGILKAKENIDDYVEQTREISEIDEEIDDNYADIDKLSIKIQKTDDKIAQVEDEISKRAEKIEEKTNEPEEASEEKTEVQEEETMSEEEIDGLVDKIMANTNEEDAMGLEPMQNDANMNIEVQTDEPKVEEKDEISEFEKTIEETTNRVRIELEQKLEAYKMELMTAAKAEVLRNEKETRKAMDELQATSLEAINVVNANLESEKSKNEALNNELNQANKTIEERNSTIEEKDSVISNKDAEIAELKAQLAAKENEIGSLKDEEAKKDEEINALKADINNYQITVKMLTLGNAPQVAQSEEEAKTR